MSNKTGTTDTDTTEVATTTDPNVAAVRAHVANLKTESPQDMQERILRQILTAETAEDVLNAGAITKADDLIGVPMTIMSLRAADSDYEQGADYYLLVDAKIVSNGDMITFQTGAMDVVAKLVALDMKHMLPITAVMERASKATKAGFYPIFLRAVEGADESF